MTETSDFEKRLLNNMSFTQDEYAAYIKLKAEGKFNVKKVTLDELREIIRSQVKAELPTDDEYRPRISEFNSPEQAAEAVRKNQEIEAEHERLRVLRESAAIVETKRVGHFLESDFPIISLQELKEKVGKMSITRAKEEHEWITDLVGRLGDFPEKLRKEVEDSVLGWLPDKREDLLETRQAAQEDTITFMQKSVPLWQEVVDVYQARISALEQQGTPEHVAELIKIGTDAAKKAHEIMKAMKKAPHDTKPKNVQKLADLLAQFYRVDAQWSKAQAELRTICLQPVPQLPSMPSLMTFLLSLTPVLRHLVELHVHTMEVR